MYIVDITYFILYGQNQHIQLGPQDSSSRYNSYFKRSTTYLRGFEKDSMHNNKYNLHTYFRGQQHI